MKPQKNGVTTKTPLEKYCYIWADLFWAFQAGII